MYEGNALIVQKMLGQRSGRAGMVTSFRVKNLVTNSTMDLGIDAGEKHIRIHGSGYIRTVRTR